MNRLLAACTVFVVIVATSTMPSLAESTNVVNDAELAYSQDINRRAEKIVATLGIADSVRSEKVQAMIAKQYRDLRGFHDARDATIRSAAGRVGSTDTARANAETRSANEIADARLKQLHGEYLSRLSVELSPEQVDQVKDGMTYGVLPLTYGVYLKMYPDLTDEQKQKIKDWLTEARELAMDAGSSKEKHAVFGKYKGRINNYLSAAGYDAKAGERKLKKTTELEGHKPK